MFIPHAAMERLGLNPADLRDPFLRRMQRAYDADFFDEWPYALETQGITHSDAKIAHIAFHVAKARRKVRLAGHEGSPGAVLAKHEAFPDASIYRTQLGNSLRVNLRRRLGSFVTHERALAVSEELLDVAEEALMRFSEPLEHGRVSPAFRRSVRDEAIPALHEAALIMGNNYDVDPTEAHARHLIHNLRLRNVLTSADA